MSSDQSQELQHRREYAGAKISKVKFLLGGNENAECFVTGSWGHSKDGTPNSVILWSTENEPTEDSSGIEKLSCKNVDSDVNDISVFSQSHFVVGLSNGDIEVFECSDGKLESKQTFSAVHNRASSTAVCVINDTIFSGSDTGSILRISAAGGTTKTSIVSTDLMEVTSLVSSGTFHLVSGHTTGQIHLWDVRQPAKPSLEMSILNKIPLVSQAVTVLNDSVTAICSHPSQPNLVSFNPIYPKNFFSSSDTGLIHWDASSLTYDSLRDVNDDHQHGNIWLSCKLWTNISLKALLEDDPKLISCFDVSENCMVVGSNACDVMCLKNLYFH